MFRYYFVSFFEEFGVPMITTRSCSRGSSFAAFHVPTTSGESGPSFLAEAKKVCGELFSDAQGHVLGEIDILRSRSKP